MNNDKRRGGIGRRIAILSKKVVKYTVSTGEVDGSMTMYGANPYRRKRKGAE